MSRFESPLAKRRVRRDIAAETLGLFAGWTLEIDGDSETTMRGFWPNQLHREMQKIGHCGVDGIVSTQVLGRLQAKGLVEQIPAFLVTESPADCYEARLDPYHLTETGKIACIGAYDHALATGNLADYTISPGLKDELNHTLNNDPIILLDPDATVLVTI